MASPHPFGLLPAGQALMTVPYSQPSSTSFLYAIPSTTPSNPKPFAHLAIFLLPGVVLPENTAAAIYTAQNPSALGPGGQGSAALNFKFLGGVGPGKESAIFKLASSANGAEGVVIGIDIEDAASVAERIQQLQSQSHQQSTALVPAPKTVSTELLAQRIIQNAFNFLSSFSGQVGPAGVEVVPLRAFQDWWRKFEAKIKNDPGLLEREQD